MEGGRPPSTESCSSLMRQKHRQSPKRAVLPRSSSPPEHARSGVPATATVMKTVAVVGRDLFNRHGSFGVSPVDWARHDGRTTLQRHSQLLLFSDGNVLRGSFSQIGAPTFFPSKIPSKEASRQGKDDADECQERDG